MSRILILGGTREATALAAKLVREGHTVITSLAGRTREPVPVEGEVRSGGFGGATGLANYLTLKEIDRLIDCTHPFASRISANAVDAAKIANVPLEVRLRPPWKRQPGDQWLEVTDLDKAVAAIPAGARVLLALGSQHIKPFAVRADVHYLVRMIDPPDKPLKLANHELLIARPGRRWQDEAAVLKDHAITHVVSRNSGGAGSYAKIEAARRLDIQVIMIARPGEATAKTTE